MDKKQNKQAGKKFFSSRKFKYGAVAAVFTALFITAVILLNVIVSAIHSKFNLYFDLSQDQLFTIGDDSIEYVQTLLKNYQDEHGEEPKIKISFFQARDRILDDKANYKPEVLNLVESYAEKFPQIEIEFNEDAASHPDKYKEYTDQSYTIDSNTIIVKNTLTGIFRYLTFDQCLVRNTDADETVWAFKGEIKLNSAINYITCRERPVASFTEGHGEKVPENLRETLLDCGFETKTVNLSMEDLDPDTRILFICSPQNDILDGKSDNVEVSVSERSRISDYLNDFGSLVVVASPETPELPVLDEILDSRGLKLVRNQVVMDDTYSNPQSNRLLFARYAESESTAALLTDKLTSQSNPPRTLMPNSAYIELTKESEENFTVEAVLTSSENAYVEIIGENGETETVKDTFNLMAISSRFTYIDSLDTYSNVILIGSESFFESTPFTAQYANSTITYQMIRLLSNEYMPEDDEYKPFQDTALDIDNGFYIAYGIVSAALIPLCVFAVGIVVYVKRKHK